MDTIQVQVIGNPVDGRLVEVTDAELRMDLPLYVPYQPDDATYQEDMAMAEYVRFVFGTPQGQLMSWSNPGMTPSVLKKVVMSILEGNRSQEGIWLLHGADVSGNLKMSPLKEVS